MDRPKRAHLSHEQCLKVLEIVASQGWLSEPAWYLSKAVHALVKNISVALTKKASPVTVQGVMTRCTVVSLQLEGSITAPLPPLQLGLRQLTLCRGFVRDLGPLPATIASLQALDWPASKACSLTALLQRLPEQLQSLAISGRLDLLVAEDPAALCVLQGAIELPAAVQALQLTRLSVRVPMPAALLKLELICCCLGEELRAPATLLQLHIQQSTIARTAATVLVLNGGLQQLRLVRASALTLSGPLPSTLQTLAVYGGMRAALGELPAGLRSLHTSGYNHAFSALPESLNEILTIAGDWYLPTTAALPQQLVALDVSTAAGFSFALLGSYRCLCRS
jgi:hypothetical protein